jgi:hypothetical protein
MRRFCGLFLGGVLVASPAFAQSQHFIGTPSCTLSLSTGLTCSGKAAGLGSDPLYVFLTADSVTATYVCINKGGNVAPGQPLVNDDVTGPTQNIDPHNGQITFTATIPVPTPPSAKDECPNGNWRIVLTSLQYTGVELFVDDASFNTILSWDFGNFP